MKRGWLLMNLGIIAVWVALVIEAFVQGEMWGATSIALIIASVLLQIGAAKNRNGLLNEAGTSSFEGIEK